MAIGQATLQFIVQMQNQAAAAIAGLTSGFGGMGSAAQAASANISNVSAAVAEAAVAVAELHAGIGVLRAGLDTFAEYEQRMSIVQKVTGDSAAQMALFEQQFDSLVGTMRGGVAVDTLANYAGQASQLGIRGSADILKFSEVMAKLSNTTADIGEQGAKEFARLLNVTGTSADGAEHLGSVITALGKQSAATEGAILHAASTVAQTTAQFKLGGDAILGLGATAASLNLPSQLFGTAVSRALISIRDNAINGTAAMRELTAITGMSAKEWENLVKSDPTAAFLKFASVVKSFNDAGKSPTAFLTSFKLQAQEEVRVLGTVGEQLERFRKDQDAARSEVGGTSLNQENEVALGTLNKQIGAVSNSWELLKKDFGQALAPAFEVALRGVGDVLDFVDEQFKRMPDWGRQVTAWTAVAIPAIAGVTTALGAIGTVLGVLSAAGAFAALGSLFTGLATAVSVSVGAILSVLALPEAAVVALVVAIGATVYEVVKHWDDIWAVLMMSPKEAVDKAWAGLQPWMQSEMDSLLATARSGWDAVLAVFRDAPGVATPALPPDVPEPYGEGELSYNVERTERMNRAYSALKNHLLPPSATDTSTNDLSGETALSPEFQKALDGLSKQSELLKKIQGQEEALAAARALPETDPQHRTDFQLQQIQGLIDQEKIRADVVASSVKHLDEATQAAAAYGAQAKNNLEIENNIREARERNGALTQADTDRIREQTQALQAARQATALSESTYEGSKALAEARAVTQEQRDYIAGQIKILDFEKEHGALTEAQRTSMLGQVRELQQTQELLGVISQVDPVSGANQKYRDAVRTLDQAMKDGTITAAQYKTLLNDLNQQTLEARDPWAAQVRSMREAIDLARIVGDYQEADRTTQEQVNSLRRQGLEVSTQQTDAMRDYNRAMEDANKLQTSGLEGWMRQVGTLRDAVLDMQKDLVTNLSDGLVGAITGTKNAWENMVQNIAKQFLTLGVNQLLKGALSGLDNNLGGLLSGFSGKDALARASGAADRLGKLDNIQSQIMTVYAGTVTVTSAANGAAGVTNAGGNPVAAMSALGSMSPSNLSAAAAAIRTMESSNRYGITGPAVTYKDGTTDNPYGAYQVMGRNVGPWTQQYYGRTLSPTEFLGNREAQDAVFNGRFQSYATRYGSYDAAAQAWLGGEGSVGKLGVRDPVTGMTVGRYSQTFDRLYAQNGGGAMGAQAQGQQVQQAAAATKALGDSARVANDNLRAASTTMQQAGSSASGASTGIQSVTQAVTGTGQQAQQAAPQIEQAGDALAAARARVAATPEGSSSVGPYGSLAGASGGSDALGLGTTALRGIAPVLGGPVGGLGTNFFLQALKLHGGGHVGYGGGQVVSMPASLFSSAPRFHDGLNDDEFAAVLQRGERVMTASQSDKVAAAAGGSGVHYYAGDNNISIQNTSTGDPAQDHQNAEMQSKMLSDMLDQHTTRWVANQQRPGGVLAR